MSASAGTIMDVAPTTLELRPGIAGLFYVTNHGAAPVTVQIEAMDWHQNQDHDTLTPSGELFTSPPMAHIAPGQRQSVRVLARPASGGEHVYRLLVSELPDAQAGDGVHVLLQFSVPVFVRRDPHAAPLLDWTMRNHRLIAANRGAQAVKLDGVVLDGAPLAGLTYILPGAARDFALPPDVLMRGGHISAHDALSGADIGADLAAAP